MKATRYLRAQIKYSPYCLHISSDTDKIRCTTFQRNVVDEISISFGGKNGGVESIPYLMKFRFNFYVFRPIFIKFGSQGNVHKNLLSELGVSRKSAQWNS